MGQPIFSKVKQNYQLQDFVGEQSSILFKITGSNYDWLKENPILWSSNESYNKMESFVKDMKVINDPAERAIKLMSDYTDRIVNDEEQKQFLIQSIEENRGLLPDFKKDTLMKAMSD